ncbi:MAG: hypothetical protein QF450_01365 [Rhodospirillales bacterium]|jgi:glutamate dehydrogenase/leucine dehydrogenase|nr:hypothetical protein [Rhodospirillales bacterium]
MKARNKFGANGTPGRPEAPLKLSSVVYVKRCAPAETCNEAISAPDIGTEHQTVSYLFADCVILRVRGQPTPGKPAEYPGARFINGRFQPVMP